MYMSKNYLTVEVAREVLSEFEWPAPYTLEDWLPDGVAMVFPRCTLLFEEGFESDMNALFLTEDTGLDNAVRLYDILASMGGPDTPGLTGYFSGTSSLDKVKNGLRDLCTTVLAHFRSSLLGDFTWVEEYKAYRVRSRIDHDAK